MHRLDAEAAAPPDEATSRTPALIVMTAAAIGFGLSLPAAKLALRELQPIQVLFWTRAVAACTLLPGMRRPRDTLPSSAIPGLLLGVILFGIFAIQLAGIHQTTAVSGSFVSGMQVIATPFIAWALIRERPSHGVLMGTAVACTGMALVVGAAPALAVGDVLVLAGALLLPFHTVVVANWTRRVGARDLIRAQTLVAGLCAVLVLHGHVNPEAALDNALPILIGGIVGGSFAVTAQAYAQRSLSAGQTGIILTLEPVVGSLVAFAWLAERPAPTIWFGGATIVCGIALATWCHPRAAGLDRERGRRIKGVLLHRAKRHSAPTHYEREPLNVPTHRDELRSAGCRLRGYLGRKRRRRGRTRD